jgi:hypothetical protein
MEWDWMGLDWMGLDGIGWDRIGLDGIGWDWTGLDWMGLDGIGRDRKGGGDPRRREEEVPPERDRENRKTVPEGNSTDSTKGLRNEAKLRDAGRSNE